MSTTSHTTNWLGISVVLLFEKPASWLFCKKQSRMIVARESVLYFWESASTSLCLPCHSFSYHQGQVSVVSVQQRGNIIHWWLIWGTNTEKGLPVCCEPKSFLCGVEKIGALWLPRKASWSEHHGQWFITQSQLSFLSTGSFFQVDLWGSQTLSWHQSIKETESKISTDEGIALFLDMNITNWCLISNSSAGWNDTL